jgi:hypothetical protein
MDDRAREGAHVFVVAGPRCGGMLRKIVLLENGASFRVEGVETRFWGCMLAVGGFCERFEEVVDGGLLERELPIGSHPAEKELKKPCGLKASFRHHFHDSLKHRSKRGTLAESIEACFPDVILRNQSERANAPVDRE